MLFSPNDDPNSAGDLDPADPAWAAAESEAKDLVARLADGSDFGTEAKVSDDKTSGADGGLLGWAPKGTYVPEFEAAIWADGVKHNDILGPIKTQFGYHVIKFDERRPSLKDRLDELATALAVDGVDFAEAATAATNTIEELSFASPGFVPKYTVNPELGGIVWGLKPGGTSAVVESSNTYLIVHVDGVETRELTPDQITGIKASGFSIWLDLYRTAARVAIDGSVVQVGGASPTP
ncbi:MAG: hypothetical protein EBU83_05525 [bacterium]|nr:hypothetical protein [Candidatus Aquidulcis sp.]